MSRTADPHSRARWTVVALATVALAGCAGPTPPPASSDPAAVVAAAAATAQAEAAAEGAAGPDDPHASARHPVELWAVQSGPLGVVVTDGDGLPLYRNDRDHAAPPATTCTGDCTKLWPPVVVTGTQPPDLAGIDPSLVSTFQRPDGKRQLTLAGWPLYFHTGDNGGLNSTYANGDDGSWFAVSPTGGHAVAG